MVSLFLFKCGQHVSAYIQTTIDLISNLVYINSGVNMLDFLHLLMMIDAFNNIKNVGDAQNCLT
jgi:hypothetical protein